MDDPVYKRMLDLEQELAEFQESSKELEQALEDELRDLELQNDTLRQALAGKDAQIASLSTHVSSLVAELGELADKLADKSRAHDAAVAELKQRLVAVEILNDDMASHDRVLENKLHMATQFNNELLERLALVENDLAMERQTNARHQMTILNLENKAASAEKATSAEKGPQSRRQSRLMARTRRESTYDYSFAEGTILDINEMLATDPPGVPERMPRSELLQRFHELCCNAETLRGKLSDFNSTLKTASVAAVSKPSTPVYTDDADTLSKLLTIVSARKKLSTASITQRKLAEPKTRTLKTAVKHFFLG